ncbi:MAG: nitroreductase family protein [Selenomonadaceae bacterium]|nr:nitroreductase family protein [Selenomonadaceae bacterium]
MENLLDLMRSRRSVRQYTDEKISDENIKKILSAALLAPSGHSKYPCEFIVVKNSETLEKMSHCRVNVAKMLTQAAAAVVVIADTEKSDTVVEDSAVAMMNMELMATSLGIGNCWIQVRNRPAENNLPSEEYLREILKFPKNFMCQSILSLGIAAKQPRQRELEKLNFSKIHEEIF